MATLSFSHKTSSIYGVWATPLGTGKVTHLHIRMTNFHAKFPVHGCGSGWNVDPALEMGMISCREEPALELWEILYSDRT